MADLVDLDLETSHLASAPPAVHELAIESRNHLMANCILDALNCAEKMLGLCESTDPWASEALIMRSDAQVVLGRFTDACLNYLVARFWMRTNRAVGYNSDILAKLDDMIDYLQYVLCNQERDRPTARSYKKQEDPKSCDEDILYTMARGQDVDMLLPIKELRALLSHRRTTGQWTLPRSEMLLIPDDDSRPRVVDVTNRCELQRVLGSKYVVRELLYSEDVLEQRRGEETGVPAGHTYTAWECVTREDSYTQRPNHRARNLLQATYLSGPVLVQVVTLLKNKEGKASLVLQRAGPAMAELDGRAWRDARREWLALNETAYFSPIPEYYRLFSAAQLDGPWAFW
ncbi:hypothetical protein AURDEDRAFT_175760 [Auricularia subglabra TFB-10046 SS5]|uniref:Uncharacterized protein n=1 Tax=Auricularia subglabra (strain TFB-10046 / SS5) TaxID=717982 RepID=J0D7V2_AURST|nr:hypothetical protein AURDEDRAFT_175760 [Auricularia subglabra TFB-10046 SS5]